ncbi:MAG: serine O-acetyltransferase EpsC [Candidatus Cryptobacteroides sp.]
MTTIDFSKFDMHAPSHGGIHIDACNVGKVVSLFSSAVFPGYYDTMPEEQKHAELYYGILSIASSIPGLETTPEKIATGLMDRLQSLKASVWTDVSAIYDVDPAAKDPAEIILCYPSVKAMLHYRLAHTLYRLGLPLVPRMITEMAHSKTGIDIHPGAEIGDYFSIDHGTGVVIGETAIVGSHVRIYQGVTLGAKSFRYDGDGKAVSGPRHPIIEDNVTIYSNSSILGRITIGHDSVIGGNIWQTESLPPYSRVVQGKSIATHFTDGGGI